MTISIKTVYSGQNRIPNELVNALLAPEERKICDYLPREYTPVWANNLEKLLPGLSADKITAFNGSAVYKVLEWVPGKRVVEVDAASPSLLRIASFFYPGWVADIDGKKLGVMVEKESGAMLVEIPEGRHVLEMRFTDTPLRIVSKYISMFSLITLIFLAFKRKANQFRIERLVKIWK
jgi:hypothetical protein